MANAKKPEDMTRAELVERLRELERADARRDELEALLRDREELTAIGRLAGAVARDFNNHLTVIATRAALVAEEPLPSETTAHIEEVLKTAERARELVSQLASFSRSQPQRGDVVDAGELLRGMIPRLGALAGERVTLQVTIDDDAPYLRIDPVHLEQIVVNLVTNACDALGDDGGEIRVSVTKVPSDTSTLVDDDGPALELSVHDGGIGMSEETRLRAFEPFFSTKPRRASAGVGLATVYALCRQHGGTAHIDSTVGAGTTVTVTFPRVKPGGSGTRARAPGRGDGSVTGPIVTARILVVEDQPSIRRLLSRLLIREGHEVIPASSAEEALTIAEREDFDLLLTDVVMPGASGLELAERLRRDRPGLPVLLTSGGEDDRALDERTAFVQKPFRLEQLRELVNELLGDAEGERVG